jgi:aspartate/methionine/tyrosine aminotransferase
MLMFEALFDHSRSIGVTASIQAPVNTRHAYLIKQLSGSIATPHTDRGRATLPVEWFELKTSSNVSDIDFVNFLAKNDVHVLPGSFFYWSKRSAPYTAFRVSMSRDRATFQTSVDKLKNAVFQFEAEHVTGVNNVFI